MIEAAQLTLVVGEIDEIVLGGIAEITKTKFRDIEGGFLSHFDYIVGQVVVADGTLGSSRAHKTVFNEVVALFTLLACGVDEEVGLTCCTLLSDLIELIAATKVTFRTSADIRASCTARHWASNALRGVSIKEIPSTFITLNTIRQIGTSQTTYKGA